jgi:hypothetical protein
LPKNNLLTGTDNEVYYYGKMADELIRYRRINAYIFNPQKFQSFGKKNYNIHEDELIVLQSVLTQDYFENMERENVNDFVKFNAYDVANPKSSQVYDNVARIQEKEEVREYEPGREERISSGQWRSCFPVGFGEWVFEKENVSGFYMILDVLKSTKRVMKTIEEVRSDLLQEYVQHMKNYEEAILLIWKIEGKKNFVFLYEKSKREGKDVIEMIIMSQSYYLTNLDVWLLVTKYEIPTIFLSSQTLAETNFERNEMVAYGNEMDDFVYLLCPRLHNDTVPKFRIIQREKMMYPLSVLKTKECHDFLMDAFENKTTPEDYIKNFKKTKTTKRKKIVLQEEEETTDVL